MSKKKKGPKLNKHGITFDRVQEIANLDNQSLINRLSIEYKNWVQTDKYKKDDPEIMKVQESLKSVKENVVTDQRYIDAKENLQKIKEELVDEEQARLEEELKNLAQPFLEDIKLYRGMFKTAMDELAQRREKGLLK